MRVLIAGVTGFIGKNLSEALLDSGHKIVALTRNVENAQKTLDSRVECVHWDGKTTEGWQDHVDGTEAVINLAGENLAGGPWTKSYKKRILNSRVNAGNAISKAILEAKQKPNVLLQASAVGYYGSRGGEELNESSSAGSGFLVDVVKQWEDSVKEVEKRNPRVVYLRTGVVLGRGEGMIDKMTLPFKIFAGGPVGSGKQWLSWIHIADELNVIRFLMEREDLSGIFNLVAPNPVQMAEFSRNFGKALNRPSWLPVPEIAIKLIFGQMGEETVLSSQKAVPKRLLEAGYVFQFPELSAALNDLFS
jgi:uncharacterized protein (TIGR01777 family)